MPWWAFIFLAVLALFSALGVIVQRNAVHCLLSLVLTLLTLAVIFIGLDAVTVGLLQAIVYAGAIMVLFLFVIMLLNLGRSGPSDIKGPWGKVIAGVGGLVLVGELLALRNVTPPWALQLPPGTVANAVAERGAVRVVAEPLFQGYLVPFEITSVLLLAAIVGAVVLAKRRL